MGNLRRSLPEEFETIIDTKDVSQDLRLACNRSEGVKLIEGWLSVTLETVELGQRGKKSRASSVFCSDVCAGLTVKST